MRNLKHTGLKYFQILKIVRFVTQISQLLYTSSARWGNCLLGNNQTQVLQIRVHGTNNTAIEVTYKNSRTTHFASLLNR